MVFLLLKNLLDYTAVARKIKEVREQSPDSELVLLRPQSMNQKPGAAQLVIYANRNFVPMSTRTEYVNEQASNYQATIARMVSHISKYLSQPRLIKIGGSISDLLETRREVIINLLGEVKKLHDEGYPLILTTGGGLRLETEKTIAEGYGREPHPREVLEKNAMDIKTLLGDVAEYVPPEEMRDIKNFDPDYLRKNIPVVSLSGYSNIPDTESDVHTLRIGEQLGLYKVIFAKDTDGVHERDPYRQTRTVRAQLFGPISHWAKVQNNPFYPNIYASQILDGEISRTDSEGKGEHLIEARAVLYLRDQTKSLRAVQVINGTKPELLRYSLDGVRMLPDNLRGLSSNGYVGSFILKGRPI